MATVKAVVDKQFFKEDGTAGVRIRISHNRKSVYIKTSIFVVKGQLTKHLEFRDPYILDIVHDMEKSYRHKIAGLGMAADHMDVREIVEAITNDDNQQIDYIQFCKDHIAKARKNGKATSADIKNTALQALIDFVGQRLPISKLNYALLIKFEAYLKEPRTMVRDIGNSPGYKQQRPGISNTSVRNYMVSLRTMFNDARAEHNDEDSGDIKIKHYPFHKYKIPVADPPKKKNWKPAQIKTFYEANKPLTQRAELARDIFILSFCMCGMNAIDIYNALEIVDGRINYNRTKTAGRRLDKALISIKVPEIVKPIIDKYADFTGKRLFRFHRQFTSNRNFNRAITVGFRSLLKVNNMSDPERDTLYSARHSFATIARNDCNFSKDDVAEALNHSTQNTVTDIYIEKSWARVDNLQAAVIQKVFG